MWCVWYFKPLDQVSPVDYLHCPNYEYCCPECSWCLPDGHDCDE